VVVAKEWVVWLHGATLVVGSLCSGGNTDGGQISGVGRVVVLYRSYVSIVVHVNKEKSDRKKGFVMCRAAVSELRHKSGRSGSGTTNHFHSGQYETRHFQFRLCFSFFWTPQSESTK
jgi:hypothetical protein